MMIWGLFQPLPGHEQLVSECNEMIQQGNYSNFSETEKLNACLDDSYKALGAAPLAVIFIPIVALLSWIGLRYGLRIFRKKINNEIFVKHFKKHTAQLWHWVFFCRG